MNNLKIQVEYCLENFPETRDSDIELTIRIWKEYYPNMINGADYNMQEDHYFVFLKDLFELPREDAVKRYRAHFQNDLNKYLPTSLEVAKQRKINEERWREAMGEATTHQRI